MLIVNDRRFLSAAFDSEEELESVVVEHSEDVFGPASLFLPKKLIRTRDGFGTIPDGIVIDLLQRRWFIVEAELAVHSVWGHIAPQVAKQLAAASQRPSKQIIIDLAVDQAKQDKSVLDKFLDQDITELDVRHYLDQILETEPIVAIPIDNIPADLREWAQTLRYVVKLWLVRKMVELGNPSNIVYEIPDEYKPSIEIKANVTTVEDGNVVYGVRLQDLLESGAIKAGDTISMTYRRRGGERKNYDGIIENDGSISVLEQSYPSLSQAAWACMQDAGSTRSTVNGWTAWRHENGRVMHEIRDAFLNTK